VGETPESKGTPLYAWMDYEPHHNAAPSKKDIQNIAAQIISRTSSVNADLLQRVELDARPVNDEFAKIWDKDVVSAQYTTHTFQIYGCVNEICLLLRGANTIGSEDPKTFIPQLDEWQNISELDKSPDGSTYIDDFQSECPNIALSKSVIDLIDRAMNCFSGVVHKSARKIVALLIQANGNAKKASNKTDPVYVRLPDEAGATRPGGKKKVEMVLSRRVEQVRK
jgi:hypothetical protein